MDFLKKLKSDGFVLLKKWRPELDTHDVATAIGKPVDVRRLLQSSNIENVQTLIPKIPHASGANQYSGTFGLGEFPLHSDLAHWAEPPRYFLLRCSQGSSTTFTRLMKIDALITTIGKEQIRNAIFLPRKKSPGVPRCALPMSFQRDGVLGIRWDRLFLTPFNRSAGIIADVIPRTEWGDCVQSIPLVERGDTLVIDNWRVLHGRSKVSAESRNRMLERIYLNTIRV